MFLTIIIPKKYVNINARIYKDIKQEASKSNQSKYHAQANYQQIISKTIIMKELYETSKWNKTLTLLLPSTFSRHEGRRSWFSDCAAMLCESPELPLVDDSLDTPPEGVVSVLVITVGVPVDMVTDTVTAGLVLSPPPPDY